MTELTIYSGQFCTKRTDFIQVFPMGESICDELIEYFHTEKNVIKRPGIVAGENGPIVDNDKKHSMDMHVPIEVTHPTITKYGEELSKVLQKYIEIFPFCKPSQFKIVEPVNIQHYPPAGGFKIWHTERSSAIHPFTTRHLVFMTYLNDVPDGGTEWFHQDKYIEAQKGYTVIWPADWTHYHRGRISQTSEKYIITGWFSYV